MKVTQENKDALNAVLTIELTKEDYGNAYEGALKSYAKQVSLPGFRPGKVPAQVVKKRFGKGLLAEEINKLVNNALSGHITENKLDVLGNPMPLNDDEEVGNWDNPADFKFQYELGLAPEFEVAFDKRKKYDYIAIQVDDKMIDEQVSDYARRYGKLSEPSEAGEKDLIMADLAEVDADGNVVEGGKAGKHTISLEFLKNEEGKKALVGLTKNDTKVIDPKVIVSDVHELEKILGLTHDELHAFESNVLLTVTEVKRLEPAEINQELLDKIYGEGNVKNEDEMRAKIKESLEATFKNDSDRLFIAEMKNALVEKYNLELPVDFLKRWIVATNEKPVTMEQVEEEIEGYLESLRWQLIENKITADNNLNVSNEELIEYTKAMMAQQFAQYGLPAEEEQLEGAVHNVLSDKKEAQRIYQMLSEQKVTNFLKENVGLKESELSMDDFVERYKKAVAVKQPEAVA